MKENKFRVIIKKSFNNDEIKELIRSLPVCLHFVNSNIGANALTVKTAINIIKSKVLISKFNGACVDLFFPEFSIASHNNYNSLQLSKDNFFRKFLNKLKSSLVLSKDSEENYNNQNCINVFDKNKPTILVFPAFLAVGGVEKNTLSVIKELKNYYNFIVISTEKLNSNQGSMLIDYLNECIVLPFDILFRRNQYVDALDMINDILKPNFIWICNGSVWLNSHIGKIREIFFDAVFIDQQIYDTDEGWINTYDSCVHHMDSIIAINQKIQSKLSITYPSRKNDITLIYPVVDTERFNANNINTNSSQLTELRKRLNIHESDFVVSMIARMSDQKNPLRLLRLAKEIQNNKLDQIKILMIGSGSLDSEIDLFIKKHSIKNVIKTGFREDIPALHKISDALILLSNYEGLPISILEALINQLPVFATDTGDTRTVINEFSCGKIIRVNQSTNQDFIDFMQFYEDIDSYKDALKLNSSLLKQKFSIKHISSQYKKLFSSKP